MFYFSPLAMDFLRIPCRYLIQIMEASPQRRYPKTKKTIENNVIEKEI
jgi:hypothetical protein